MLKSVLQILLINDSNNKSEPADYLIMKLLKILITLISIVFSYNLSAQSCEFDTLYRTDSPRGSGIPANLLSSNNYYFVVDFVVVNNIMGSKLAPRFRKFNQCGDLLIEKRDTILLEYNLLGTFSEIIETSNSKLNICIFGKNIKVYEIDSNFNYKTLFSISNNFGTIKNFAQQDLNQFTFVGHKKDKATAFSLDTLGSLLWQNTDSVTSYFNKISIGNNGKFYLFGSRQNNFIQANIDLNGNIKIEKIFTNNYPLDSLNYRLTYSFPSNKLYTLTLKNNFLLFSKFDSSTLLEKDTQLSQIIGKATKVFNLISNSNGFSALTDYENYLVDSNLKPFFNQACSNYYTTGTSNSSITYNKTFTNLFCVNDSFLVTGGNYNTQTSNGQYSDFRFYKTKIGKNNYTPQLVNLGLKLFTDPTHNLDSFTKIKLLNVPSIVTKWGISKSLELFQYTDSCLIKFSSLKQDTINVCVRSYLYNQYSYDACKTIIYESKVKPKDTSTIGFIEQELVDLIIYPNPTKNSITITNKSNLLGKKYIITNLIGQTIITGKLNLDETIINLETLKSGVYLFSIDGFNKQSIKVIKE